MISVVGSGPNDLMATATIPSDSLFFDGHFPGNPVVPGVALLCLVEAAVRMGSAYTREKVRVSGVRRVKFRKLLQEGGMFTVRTGENPNDVGRSIAFEILHGDEIACDGIAQIDCIS